jgi:glycosyltransferase involved in cell wall biosynthesis
MKIIGIDIRKRLDFGIGSYVRSLIKGLTIFPGEDLRYLLLTRSEDAASETESKSPQFTFRSLSISKRSPFQGHLPREISIDLLHAPHYLTPLPRHSPLLLTVHDLIHLFPPKEPPIHFKQRSFHSSYDRAKRFYHQILSGKILQDRLRIASEVIAVSKSMADELAEKTGFSQKKINVILNCISDDFFKQITANEAAEILRGFELPDRQYLLYCGNDLYHKNLTGLFAAMSLMRSRRKSMPLLVLSGPPRQKMIFRMAKAAGIQNLVRILSKMDIRNLAHLYSRSIGLVAPSLAEGFGLPVVEAMASGIPVVCSDLPVFHEVTRGNALFFDPYSAESMAMEIDRLLDDTNLAQTLSETGRNIALNYRLEFFVKAHLKVYNRLVGEFSE